MVCKLSSEKPSHRSAAANDIISTLSHFAGDDEGCGAKPPPGAALENPTEAFPHHSNREHRCRSINAERERRQNSPLESAAGVSTILAGLSLTIQLQECIPVFPLSTPMQITASPVSSSAGAADSSSESAGVGYVTPRIIVDTNKKVRGQ